MLNFWEYNVWGWVMTLAVLLASLLAGNVMRRKIPFLRKSLIPTSVIGGVILLAVAAIYKLITGDVMFDTALFDHKGTVCLEIITYHALALGFVASAFKTTGGKLSKKRTTEIFNTGVTTVATYLLQGIVGLGITIVLALLIKDFFSAAGLLLPFGYGQGTGQAMNYGQIYENDFGFSGGMNFGLAIAALGFLSAALGGVFHLNITRRRDKLVLSKRTDGTTQADEIESPDEIPMQESLDKMTVQIALIVLAYGIAYAIMYVLGNIFPGMRSVIYGFNFLIGVLSATIVKVIIGRLRKTGLMGRKYTNNFLMTRISNFFFDVMIVSGVAAIRLDTLKEYWAILLFLGIVGLVITYAYCRFVSKKLFPDYYEEQFLMLYGMLTGTASTGMILLREIDGEFKTPASDNMVYQNFPAIVFGLPIMFLATFAPTRPILTLIILVGFFAVLNVILFRSFIFKKKKTKDGQTEKE